MLQLAQGNFTASQVDNALRGIYGNRHLSFQFLLLDDTDKFKKDVTSLVVAEQSSVSMDSEVTQIKRSANLQMRDDGSINWPQDRIQVIAKLYIPSGRVLSRTYVFMQPQMPTLYQTLQDAPQTGGYVQWSQGIFLLSSPTRSYQGSTTYRTVQAYDKMQILTDWGFTARYVVTQGTNYVDAVTTILQGAGITTINIEPTTLALPIWLDWPPDTSRLEVCNALLKIINYQPLHVDEVGFFTSFPYVIPQNRPEETSYITDNRSVILTDSTDTSDYFAVPNTWVGVVSEPDSLYLTYTYVNDKADSPTSTVSRGRAITKYINVNAADLTSLQGLVQQQATKDSMVHQVTLNTAVMPIHSYDDVYHITHNKLGIDAKFEEVSWKMELKNGGTMQHVAKEVVTI